MIILPHVEKLGNPKFNHMKLIFTVAIIFWLIMQNITNGLVLSDIQNSYLKGDSCQFVITNISNDKLLYYITMEMKTKDVWKEILYSIDNPDSKLAIMSPINSKEKISRIIIFKDIFYDHISEEDTLRLKLIYCVNNEVNYRYSYSNEFIIK
jgi:hypothetical protein